MISVTHTSTVRCLVAVDRERPWSVIQNVVNPSFLGSLRAVLKLNGWKYYKYKKEGNESCYRIFGKLPVFLFFYFVPSDELCPGVGKNTWIKFCKGCFNHKINSRKICRYFTDMQRNGESCIKWFKLTFFTKFSRVTVLTDALEHLQFVFGDNASSSVLAWIGRTRKL